MSLAGIAARAAVLKEQRKNQPCPQCGERLDPARKRYCPNCGELDQAEMERILQNKNIGSQGNKALGIWFLSLALVIGVVIVIIASF